MAPTRDYYTVLGVSSNATSDEVKKQYRRLAKQYHPDANQNNPKAADRFKEISEAYQVLGDVEKRKQYDEMRRLGAFGFGGTGQGGAGARTRGGAQGSRGGPRGAGDPNAGRFQDFDIGGLGGLGDIFSSMFGGERTTGAGRGAASEVGQTVETTLEVPFRVAVAGGKVPIELEVNEECGTCRGTGGAPGSTMRQCSECSGRGVISFGQGGFAVNRPCPMCMGRGQLPSQRCPTCKGTGDLRRRRTVSITVPPGTDSGQKIRLKGQGGGGSGGAPAGDLLITFQVLDDRFYRREGLDLVAVVPLNIVQATLGTKVSIRSLDGKRVSVRVPPGTSAGRRFRVRGQGIEREGKKGDLIVEATVQAPEKITEEQQALLKQFAELGGMKF